MIASSAASSSRGGRADAVGATETSRSRTVAVARLAGALADELPHHAEPAGRG
jgi:hypothetical protein